MTAHVFEDRRIFLRHIIPRQTAQELSPVSGVKGRENVKTRWLLVFEKPRCAVTVDGNEESIDVHTIEAKPS